MSTRGRPGTVPPRDVSLVSDVGERIAEVAHGGGAKAAPIVNTARMGRKNSAVGQRPIEAARAAIETRCRAAEAYAIEISERLIVVRDALREHTERATADRRTKEAEIARQKAELATAQESMRTLQAELAQEKKRGLDERKRGDGLAEKLKSAETAARATEDQNKALKSQLQAAGSTTATLRSQIGTLQKQKASAEKHAAQVRNTIAFQLGQALIQAGETWRGARVLPDALLALLREARLRKQRRQEREEVGRYDVLTAPTTVEAHVPACQVLSILDEMSEASWGSDLKLFRLVRNRWKAQIDGSNSQFALLESCWNGNGGSWEYAFTSPGLKHANAQALIEVIAHLRRRNMRIAFWNKEDPMHYDRFLPIARQADVIFTTDAAKVSDYRRDLPSARIEVLPFAAQPRLCNPAERSRIDQEPLCFAGSYYSEGHDARKCQMEALLPAIIEFRGAIYDRMSGIEGGRYRYPPQYRPFIRPAVPFSEMVKLYRSFKVFLNVNTIPDSPTMMSRRVYELLASGTPVVSSPSEALERTFGGIVQFASSRSQAIDAVGKLIDDTPFRNRIAHLGYREVMRNHTYRKRLDTLLPAMGISHTAVTTLISVILCTMRPHMIDRIIENVTRQSYERIEVIIIAQGFSHQHKERLANAISARRRNIERVEIVVDDSARTLGERFNHGVELSRGAYISKMDDDDLYFENYLSDMLLPFSFGDYGLVGKKEVFMYLEGSSKLVRRYPGMQHRTTEFVAGPTFVARRETFLATPFPLVNQGEDSAFLEKVKAAGHQIYACDPYNFIQWRHLKVDAHTWKADDASFLKSSCTDIESDHLDVERVRV